MAKISAYPDGSTPQNSDNFIIARGGRNYKLFWSSMLTGLQTMLTVIESMFSFSDITTANSDTTKHGLLPKLSGQAGQYLGGDGNWYDLPITLNLFMDNTASSIAGYKTLTQVRPVAAETNVSASIPAANTVIEEFAAAADQFSFVSAQVLHVHVHLAKTAGVKTATAHVSVYHRTSGGTETLLGQSAETGNLSGSSTPYDLDVSVPDTAFASTDRVVIKFFGTPGGAGTDPTVAVYFQGATDSRIEIGTSPSLSGYAPLASPTFTGTPAAPTAAAGTNTTQLATTAFFQQEKLIPETNTNPLFRCDAPGGASAFVGTIASLPGGAPTTLTYNVTSGQEGALKPLVTTTLAKVILYNTTRGTNALISDCNTTTNTVTLTANVPAGWQVGDTITIASQTVTGAPISYLDLQIVSGPTGKGALMLELNIISATPGDNMRVHPYEAYGGSKQQTAQALVANLNGMQTKFVKITGDKFCLGWTGTPANIIVSEMGSQT